MTRTILIVEDDPFIAMDLQDTFEEAGYTVLGPVAAVAPGLQIISQTQPDVAMLDYNLGRETSIPIAQKLDAASVPYIFLSGQVESVIAANNTEQRKVFKKPFDGEQIIAFVDSVLEARQAG